MDREISALYFWPLISRSEKLHRRACQDNRLDLVKKLSFCPALSYDTNNETSMTEHSNTPPTPTVVC